MDWSIIIGVEGDYRGWGGGLVRKRGDVGFFVH